MRGQAVQRTMGVASPAANAADSQPDPIDGLLRQYRTMWQKMSAAQQKAFLDSGGTTPEQYERTLRSKGTPAAPAARETQTAPRATVDVLDSLTTSLQDLNAIRDGNLARVQKEGCPPEVASRLADLRSRLRQADPPQPKDRAAAGDPMAIASDWFKQAPKAEAPLPGADTHDGKLLDNVLGESAARPAETRRKDTEEEIARIKAEIAQLSGACGALGKK